MYFKQMSNRVFAACLVAFSIILHACGFDEQSKREKEKEKIRTMDSLFKDAGNIPEMEESDSTIAPE